MKMPQSNIFCASADEVRELFGDYLDGVDPCVVLCVSARPLSPEAREAMRKSAAALGYGENACTWATLLPRDPSAEGGDIALDPQALFLLVEGLDPLCIVGLDEEATAQLGSAFRTAFEPDAPARVFGRPAVMFRHFEGQLESERGKQHAWHLLKSLPKR